MDDSRIKDIVYKRRNGEPIINDIEAIASCKNEQSRDIIDNARLGSYDNYGNYIIIPDIKNELISMPKLVLNSKNNGSVKEYELISKIPIFGDVFFKLKVGTYEAVLTLTENVSREAGGYLEVYDEVIESIPLGKERLPDSIIFRNFHVQKDSSDFGKREEPYSYSNILTRKVYLSLLSKELKEISKFDEHEAFDNMIATLKSGGDYGKKVLKEFVERLKDRPGIFEIERNENYNKAVNEVLLSSLDISTTQGDKENYLIRKIYFKVLNARNQNIQQWLKLANEKIDEQFVNRIVNKAIDEFNSNLQEDEESVDELYAKLFGKKIGVKKRTLEKPILKQGKESHKGQSKEDKIKSILEKKTGKKTPANKKLKASKAKAQKKLKAKKPTAKKKAVKKKVVKKKAKIKSKKKKIKKAKAPAKAKNKVATLKPAAPAKAKKKKKDEVNIAIKLALVTKNESEKENIPMSSSNLNFLNIRQALKSGVSKEKANIITSLNNTANADDQRKSGLDNVREKESIVERIENKQDNQNSQQINETITNQHINQSNSQSDVNGLHNNSHSNTFDHNNIGQGMHSNTQETGAASINPTFNNAHVNNAMHNQSASPNPSATPTQN